MKTPAVEAVALSKRYASGTVAVREVSFAVAGGEIFGLLGQNGAGKTTTVRMLVGLLRPTGGTARICGIDVARRSRAARELIGFAAQVASVDPLLTVEENLVLVGRLRGLSRSGATGRARELIDRLDLSQVRSTRAVLLSGGMRRRTDLAQALVGEPRVLFLDEPTVGLDPESRHQLWEVILELRAAGTTVVLTTHYLEEADRLCDRVAIIANGELIADDTPAALKAGVGEEAVAVTVDAERDTTACATAAAALAPLAMRPPEIAGAIITASLDRGSTLWDAVAALHASGVSVLGLTVRGPTLEDVYLHHTAGATRAAS